MVKTRGAGGKKSGDGGDGEKKKWPVKRARPGRQYPRKGGIYAKKATAEEAVPMAVDEASVAGSSSGPAENTVEETPVVPPAETTVEENPVVPPAETADEQTPVVPDVPPVDLPSVGEDDEEETDEEEETGEKAAEGEERVETEAADVEGEETPADVQGEETVVVDETATVDAAAADEMDMALKPSLYLPSSAYTKHVKLATRCYLKDVFDTFDSLLPPMSEYERDWFETHPQFRHIFHMPRDHNHKVQGMWMLVLRTAETMKKKELWFVVNGVPVRYGLREHALLSGLNCRNFPLGYRTMGNMEFVTHHFGDSMVRQEDVKVKLLAMRQPGEERLKMAVLFFLSSIICVHKKVGEGAPDVSDEFMRAVDDLQYCKTFPWGRLSFNFIMDEVIHTVEHFRDIGEVKEKVQWAIPGFCLPLEMLAFEAIPKLGTRFRTSVPGADPTCPRMCKSKFKKGDMKGIPIDYINKELGEDRNITSILPVQEPEKRLLRRIYERDDDRDTDDIIVDSWTKRLNKGLDVFFQDMLDEDFAARGGDGAAAAVDVTQPPPPTVQSLVGELEKIMKKLEDIEGKVNGLESRLKVVEDVVLSSR